MAQPRSPARAGAQRLRGPALARASGAQGRGVCVCVSQRWRGRVVWRVRGEVAGGARRAPVVPGVAEPPPLEGGAPAGADHRDGARARLSPRRGSTPNRPRTPIPNRPEIDQSATPDSRSAPLRPQIVRRSSPRSDPGPGRPQIDPKQTPEEQLGPASTPHGRRSTPTPPEMETYRPQIEPHIHQPRGFQRLCW